MNIKLLKSKFDEGLTHMRTDVVIAESESCNYCKTWKADANLIQRKQTIDKIDRTDLK